MATIVYKLGGSLLTLPDLATRLQRVLSARSDARALFVAGGGSAADIVRGWDRIHQLGEERSHWLGLEAMSFNEALLLELVPESCPVESRQAALEAWEADRIPILRAAEFLHRHEQQHGSSLPHNWNVTSDSIAAWLVGHLEADALVLLKSVNAPVDAGTSKLRPESDDVDPFFRRLAAELPELGWINLRSENQRLVRIDV